MIRVHFKVYTTGLILILMSWGLQHLLDSAAVFGVGQAYESKALSSELSAQKWEETYEDRLERLEKQAELSELYTKFSKSDSDKGQEKLLKKIDNLREDISDLNEDISEVESEIEEEASESRFEGQFTGVKGSSNQALMTKLGLQARILFDLLTVVGVFMVSIASVRILRTPPEPNDPAAASTRWLGVVTLGLVLLTILMQGVVSLIEDRHGTSTYDASSAQQVSSASSQEIYEVEDMMREYKRSGASGTKSAATATRR